jgi:hypothetical protein
MNVVDGEVETMPCGKVRKPGNHHVHTHKEDNNGLAAAFNELIEDPECPKEIGDILRSVVAEAEATSDKFGDVLSKHIEAVMEDALAPYNGDHEAAKKAGFAPNDDMIAEIKRRFHADADGEIELNLEWTKRGWVAEFNPGEKLLNDHKDAVDAAALAAETTTNARPSADRKAVAQRAAKRRANKKQTKEDK